jgi:hypothetical protein
MDFRLKRPSLLGHCRREQTCYRENAFEAFRDCRSVNLIEDVPTFLLGYDDLRSGQLVQVPRNNRAVLRQTGGDGGDIATPQQDKLAQHRDARRLTQRLEESRVKNRDAPPSGLLS